MIDVTPDVIVALGLGLVGTVLLARHFYDGKKAPATANESVLRAELEKAEAKVDELRAKLSISSPPREPKRELRIWMDGAFDMMHYGHVNAFRQGRALGTHLVVGVNDDQSITKCKGTPPVMNDEERLAMVGACKFVDEVVPKVPYVMSDEYVRWMIETYRIDLVVHGDDPCIVDGRDVYESAQKLGKYATIPRTEGVSTTEIVGRMLLLTTDHHARPPTTLPAGASASEAAVVEQTASEHASPLLTAAAADGSQGAGRKLTEALPLLPALPARDAGAAGAGSVAGSGGKSLMRRREDSSFVRESKFLTTSRMLRLFADGCTAPPAGAKIVYVDGGWDMFHAGHVALLAAARALGDYLLVGVHNDVVVNRHRGRNFPIMNLNERTLSVLSCRHVSDVVIDPPWHMTRDMIAALGISVVAHGSKHDPNDDGGRDPYAVPKEMGIFVEVPSSADLTVDAVVSRIHANHERLQAKVEKKLASEREYYDARYGFAEERQ